MTDSTRYWILGQIRCFRKTASSAPVLPFTEVLVPQLVNEILQELQITVRERVYTPFVTLCVFLWQVLSEDHSCREAVARLMAFRIANGCRPCSPDTNPYCRARKRLPEALFPLLVRKVGKWLQQQVPDAWLFHGRRGKRLGKYDHLISWQKPKQCPSWMDKETFDSLPEELTLREIKFTIVEKGKRPKEITLITTLLDAEVFTTEELAELYTIRWRAEIDLRSLKSVMEMDVLRCKTPEMVRKEVWTHLLAYNLIRTVIAKAAQAYKRRPHTVSFKGAMQTINAFRDYMLMDLTSNWYTELLKAIAYHEVGDRPGRYEPRARKRRPKPYKLLQIPRSEARKRKPGKTYD